MSESLWIDELSRKHEYGPAYEDAFPLEVLHEGERYTILTPDILPDPERWQIRSTVRSDQPTLAYGKWGNANAGDED